MHITEVLRIAAEAWNRTKPGDDPDFNDCALSHREYLIAHAEAVIRGGAATSEFERAVKEIADAQLKAPEPEPGASETQDRAPAKRNGARRK